MKGTQERWLMSLPGSTVLDLLRSAEFFGSTLVEVHGIHKSGVNKNSHSGASARGGAG
jgi:hypothetical protein